MRDERRGAVLVESWLVQPLDPGTFPFSLRGFTPRQDYTYTRYLPEGTASGA